MPKFFGCCKHEEIQVKISKLERQIEHLKKKKKEVERQVKNFGAPTATQFLAALPGMAIDGLSTYFLANFMEGSEFLEKFAASALKSMVPALAHMVSLNLTGVTQFTIPNISYFFNSGILTGGAQALMTFILTSAGVEDELATQIAAGFSILVLGAYANEQKFPVSYFDNQFLRDYHDKITSLEVELAALRRQLKNLKSASVPVGEPALHKQPASTGGLKDSLLAAAPGANAV